MAWNTLTYACGHTEDKQLYGQHAERERIVAAAGREDCPACRAAAAQAASEAAGLPALLACNSAFPRTPLSMPPAARPCPAGGLARASLPAQRQRRLLGFSCARSRPCRSTSLPSS